MTKLEIMRCLKRYVARELYPLIVEIPAPAAAPGSNFEMAA